MNELDLMKKVIEHFGKLMSRYTQDKLIFGDGFIVFGDRSIEIIEPTKVIRVGDKWHYPKKIDEAKVKEAIEKAIKATDNNDFDIHADVFERILKKELGL